VYTVLVLVLIIMMVCERPPLSTIAKLNLLYRLWCITTYRQPEGNTNKQLQSRIKQHTNSWLSPHCAAVHT